jgi:hypothetical protein
MRTSWCPSRQAGETDGRRVSGFNHYGRGETDGNRLITFVAVLWLTKASTTRASARVVHRLSFMSLDLGATLEHPSYNLARHYDVVLVRHVLAFADLLCYDTDLTLLFSFNVSSPTTYGMRLRAGRAGHLSSARGPKPAARSAQPACGSSVQ